MPDTGVGANDGIAIEVYWVNVATGGVPTVISVTVSIDTLLSIDWNNWYVLVIELFNFIAFVILPSGKIAFNCNIALPLIIFAKVIVQFIRICEIKFA